VNGAKPAIIQGFGRVFQCFGGFRKTAPWRFLNQKPASFRCEKRFARRGKSRQKRFFKQAGGFVAFVLV
jgi:hypothetical protein